jgi:cell wall-associated NlpC family hydrolase
MSSKLLGAAAAATVAPLALVLGIGLGSASGSANTGQLASDPSCLGTTGSGERLNATQAQNAQLIYQLAVQMKLPSRAAVVAIATAMQESGLINQKKATNLDSLGLFQQRPSQGWGSPAQITDPIHATKTFYQRLLKIKDWQGMPLTQAAQSVQRSLFPSAYAKWEAFATKLVTTLATQAGTCSGDIASSGIGKAILAHATKWMGMAYQYGGGDQRGPNAGQNSNGSGQPGFDCSGLTVYAVYKATNGKVLLPRVAADQFRDRRFKHIPYSQLQPGDLVFWPGSDGTATAPGHVGIYAGNQRFFNAPFTGAKLRYDSMAPGTYRYRTFIAGARIT